MVVRLFVLLGALLTPLPSAAQPPKPRLDAYGDPLPEGAVARLGTVRLMHPAGVASSVAPTGRIASVAVSPDGKLVASGQRQGLLRNIAPLSDDERPGSIYLWDAATGKRVREIETADTPVGALCFSADGRTLYAGCGGRVCAWQVATGRLLWEKEAIKIPRGLATAHFWTVDYVNRIYGSASIPVDRLLLVGDRLIALYAGHFNGGRDFYYEPQKAVRFFDARTGKLLPTPAALESTVFFESVYQPTIPRLFYEVAVAPDASRAAAVVGRVERKDQRPGHLKVLRHSERRLEVIDVASGEVAKSWATTARSCAG
jgi:hypothetical protein